MGGGRRISFFEKSTLKNYFLAPTPGESAYHLPTCINVQPGSKMGRRGENIWLFHLEKYMKSFNCLPGYMKVYFEMDVVHFSLPRIKQREGSSFSQGNEGNPGGLHPVTNPWASGKSVNLPEPVSSSVKPGSWAL